MDDELVGDDVLDVAADEVSGVAAADEVRGGVDGGLLT